MRPRRRDDLAVALRGGHASALLVGVVEERRLLDLAQRLAARLRVQAGAHRAAGISSADGTALSFMDEAMLSAVLQPGQANGRALARRALVGARRTRRRARGQPLPARWAGSTRTKGPARSSPRGLCIERLGIDDFEAVERLIARRQRGDT
jgi:hypothetical protein